MRDPFNMLCGKKAAKGAAKTEQAGFLQGKESDQRYRSERRQYVNAPNATATDNSTGPSDVTDLAHVFDPHAL